MLPALEMNRASDKKSISPWNEYDGVAGFVPPTAAFPIVVAKERLHHRRVCMCTSVVSGVRVSRQPQTFNINIGLSWSIGGHSSDGFAFSTHRPREITLLI